MYIIESDLKQENKLGLHNTAQCCPWSLRIAEVMITNKTTFSKFYEQFWTNDIYFLRVSLWCLVHTRDHCTKWLNNIIKDIWSIRDNKANLRDLIAATGLAILLKFDPIHQFFSPCDLEIWWMTNNFRAHLLYYINIWASYEIFRWIQTEVTVRKRPIWVKIDNFFSRVTLNFDGWLWKTIGHLS